MSRVAYLGPAGTFSHQAARDLAEPGVELVPAADAQAVVNGILAGEFAAGVVPFESSQEGEVGSTLDMIATLDGTPVIAAERVLPVTFNLYRLPGDEAPLSTVLSHPFALAQCSRELQVRGVETISTSSTAAACQALARDRASGQAALAGPGAGEAYGLETAATGLENQVGAMTRFVKLAPRCDGPTVRDRSAFVIRPRMDQPGGLVRILQQFSLRSINLTSITSRPARDRLGNYWFYLECEGHIVQPTIKDAVMSILREAGDITFLGSFPEDPSRPAAPVASDEATAFRRYSAMRGMISGLGE